MNKEEIKPNLMNTIFAKTMEMFTWIGLIIIAIPGLIYFIGTKGFVGISSACSNWNEPAASFWQTTKGIKMSGDLLFIDNFKCMDCLSMIGIMVLVLVSLVSLTVTIPKMNAKYKVITGFVIIEFIIVIIRPFLAGVTG